MRRIRTTLVIYLKKRRFYLDLEGHTKHIEKVNHQLKTKIKENRKILDYSWFVEPGHFYSPLVHLKAVNKHNLLDLSSKRVQQTKVDFPGIDLRTNSQWLLAYKLAKQNSGIPNYEKNKSLRYKYNNDQFGRQDANILFLFLRHFKPKKVIEVGSGWSSALMLDTVELFRDWKPSLTFIEPYPARLYSVLRNKDKKMCKIIVKPAQEVPSSLYTSLSKNDVLFIDSSHVSKHQSDVNFLFFEILPNLQPGVIVHIHDIFYPFEYPLQWVKDENRNWNEVYLLRSLLTGSKLFEILLWPSYLKALDQKKFEQLIPKAAGPGGSIWLRKV